MCSSDLGGTRDRLQDAGSKELAKLAKKIGNSQVGNMLGAAREKRDALLRFIHQRLAQVQAVQKAEQDEMKDRRQWYLRLARSTPGYTLPDPTRWRETAVLYKRAAVAACAGDLGRAGHLLDDAVRAERAAFQSVPKQVDVPDGVKATAENAEERPFVEAGEGCPPTAAPELMHLADAVIRVSDSMPEMGIAPDRPTHNWWEIVEEELPEDKKRGGQTRGAVSVRRDEGAEKDTREGEKKSAQDAAETEHARAAAEREAAVRAEVAPDQERPRDKRPRKK
mgnify:CR=1 FL=1